MSVTTQPRPDFDMSSEYSRPERPAVKSDWIERFAAARIIKEEKLIQLDDATELSTSPIFDNRARTEALGSQGLGGANRLSDRTDYTDRYAGANQAERVGRSVSSDPEAVARAVYAELDGGLPSPEVPNLLELSPEAQDAMRIGESLVIQRKEEQGFNWFTSN